MLKGRRYKLMFFKLFRQTRKERPTIRTMKTRGVWVRFFYHLNSILHVGRSKRDIYRAIHGKGNNSAWR